MPSTTVEQARADRQVPRSAFSAVVVLTGKAARKIGLLGARHDASRVWVHFPAESFPANLRLIHDYNLRPADAAEAAKVGMDFV